MSVQRDNNDLEAPRNPPGKKQLTAAAP